ncbi:hypothetical protein ACFQ8W_00185 [Streptomyces sp. NPDC056508]|uniref:hypothetical protein n=1 Tax=Streptomyces sp. NPDC056508 TaxID=3345845 RepID=UPI0036895C5B
MQKKTDDSNGLLRAAGIGVAMSVVIGALGLGQIGWILVGLELFIAAALVVAHVASRRGAKAAG